jgi:hypothetical protein
MQSAPVSHLVFTTFEGRHWSGSYQILEGRVHVQSRLGRMSARLAGNARQSAQALLDVIVAMHLSAQQA